MYKSLVLSHQIMYPRFPSAYGTFHGNSALSKFKTSGALTILHCQHHQDTHESYMFSFYILLLLFILFFVV